MKKQFCKILLAVSFLFLVPALCMSQNLKGIWKLVQSEGSSQVVRYKVLDKDGNYFNVDAYIKDAVDVSSGSRSSDDVFCPYKITRSGEYSIIAKGLYCEKLRNEHGRSANAIVPISYRIDGKKMTLLFRLGNNVYREVYQKVSKLGTGDFLPCLPLGLPEFFRKIDCLQLPAIKGFPHHLHALCQKAFPLSPLSGRLLQFHDFLHLPIGFAGNHTLSIAFQILAVHRAFHSLLFTTSSFIIASARKMRHALYAEPSIPRNIPKEVRHSRSASPTWPSDLPQ